MGRKPAHPTNSKLRVSGFPPQPRSALPLIDPPNLLRPILGLAYNAPTGSAFSCAGQSKGKDSVFCIHVVMASYDIDRIT
jgi:hypothetical protein